jgi:hypothetical protein
MRSGLTLMAKPPANSFSLAGGSKVKMLGVRPHSSACKTLPTSMSNFGCPSLCPAFLSVSPAPPPPSLSQSYTLLVFVCLCSCPASRVYVRPCARVCVSVSVGVCVRECDRGGRRDGERDREVLVHVHIRLPLPQVRPCMCMWVGEWFSVTRICHAHVQHASVGTHGDGCMQGKTCKYIKRTSTGNGACYPF